VPEAVLELWHSGGFVMPPLVLASLALWYAIGYRAVLLRGPVVQVARARLEAIPPVLRARKNVVDEVVSPLRQELSAFSRLVVSMVGLAPLVGLLGTVTGMIETFASLGDQTLFARSGGIAGGIAQALVSTQMGLAVAIPGLLAGRLLSRKQGRLEDALDELVAHTLAESVPASCREEAA
jgi:biopolymer transport protein ExbB